jgi:cytochrome c
LAVTNYGVEGESGLSLQRKSDGLLGQGRQPVATSLPSPERGKGLFKKVCAVCDHLENEGIKATF